MTSEVTKLIHVILDFGIKQHSVGRLIHEKHRIYFEYLPEFIETQLPLSPLKLPLMPGLQNFDSSLFEGLPGVFDDNLPDGWGRLLLDRAMRSQGKLASDLTCLDRLAHVGQHGLGALTYEPDKSKHLHHTAVLNLDQIAADAQHVLLDGTSQAVLEKLIVLNGSSAGARPKALIAVNKDKIKILHGAQMIPQDFSHWIVKFPNTVDGQDAGAIEYCYALMAKEAGVEFPDIHLFSAKNTAGYFAAKRFDRQGKIRLHMHTACGLLHADFRTPTLDYDDLLKLTLVLTKNSQQVEKMFRLAVFNVLAHNRDDHSRNFAFLMDHTGQWKLVPAYDLTFSAGPGGEQSTMVLGNGLSPDLKLLRTLGNKHQIKSSTVEQIITQTCSALANWKNLAKNIGVHNDNISLIQKRFNAIQQAG